MSEKDKYYMIALTMWILKNNIKDIYIHIHTRNRLTDTESKIVVAKEEREESRDK